MERGGHDAAHTTSGLEDSKLHLEAQQDQGYLDHECSGSHWDLDLVL